MRILRLAATLAAVSLMSGCLYTRIKVPRGYRSASPAEVKTAPDDPVVSGEGCNKSALWLFAWGDASYATAVKKALEGKPESAILYDVRADVRANAFVLGLYTKVCTVVTGKVGKL